MGIHRVLPVLTVLHGGVLIAPKQQQLATGCCKYHTLRMRNNLQRCRRIIIAPRTQCKIIARFQLADVPHTTLPLAMPMPASPLLPLPCSL